MQRITTSTKAADLFGAGKDGFKNGDLENGILPTDFNAAWCNLVQEELANIVEGAGLVLSGASYTQVRQAVKRLFGGNVTTVNFAASPFAVTPDHAGLILVDATAGNVVIDLPAVNVIAAKLDYRFVRADATANTVTGNCDGTDAFVGGATTFTLTGQGDFKSIAGDADELWAITAANAGEAPKQIQPILASVAGSDLTLTLSPTKLDFRATPLTSGTINARTIAAAISLVVPSGATLGTINATAARLVLLAIDNGGTVELAVVNLAGGVNLDETTLISTTALSAASDSANVVYSTTARASLPFRVVGFVDSTQAAAGTWATDPSTKQGAGGQALAALSSLGYGQTWQDVIGSRSSGVTYYNTTGKPITVMISVANGAAGSLQAAVNGLTLAISNHASGSAYTSITFIVPPGAAYVGTASYPILIWTELR